MSDLIWKQYHRSAIEGVMVFNATFDNISAIA